MKNSGETIQKLKESIVAFLKKGKDILIQNKKIAIPAGTVLIVLILVLIAVSTGQKDKEGTTNGQVAGLEADYESVIPVPEVPLEECSVAEINSLISSYFTALAEGDTDTVAASKSYLSDRERISIREKSNYIESYPEVICYTKPGPMEDSYVVYVYYEAKFVNIDTLAPGVKSYLIQKSDEGNYLILDGEQDQNIADYLLAISAQEDVGDLFNRATVKYAEAKENDPVLNEFLTTLSEKIKKAVSVELAKLEVAETIEAEVETETETEVETTEEETVETENTVQIVAATDVVNIRSSDSETADKLGKAQIGEQFTLLETKGNGWSKIDYNGTEAYMKTEFLTAVDAQSIDEAPADNQEVANTAPQQSQGTVKVKETVNIRGTASETGNKVGAAYEGETLELLMKQADGWTKIKYNGKTAYVKSEFVE